MSTTRSIGRMRSLRLCAMGHLSWLIMNGLRNSSIREGQSGQHDVRPGTIVAPPGAEENGWFFIVSDVATDDATDNLSTCSEDGTRYHESQASPIPFPPELKEYVNDLPATVWNDVAYFVLRLSVLQIKNKRLTHVEVLRKTIRFFLCEKLTRFSTTVLEGFVSGVGVKLEFFHGLRRCINMKDLRMTLLPQTFSELSEVVNLINKGNDNIQALSLLPNDFGSACCWSLWNLASISENLRELKMVYDGDSILESGSTISKIIKSQKLTSLWLFHTGKSDETLEVLQLILNNSNLKVFYHKDLPKALRLITNRVVPLRRLDLFWYCNELGYSYITLSPDALFDIVMKCPQVTYLSIMTPICIGRLMDFMPCLDSLRLHKLNLSSCYKNCLKVSHFHKLISLEFIDVNTMNYDIISMLALNCPFLKKLKIVTTSLEAKGSLELPPNRPAFPCLEKVVLSPRYVGDDFVFPHQLEKVWQLGTALSTYILEGASSLTSITIMYVDNDIDNPDDVPDRVILKKLLCNDKPNLGQVFLVSPPDVTVDLIRALIESNPGIYSVGSIFTWPLSRETKKQIFQTFGRRLFLRA